MTETASLRALALVCSLKASPAPSSSDLMARQVLEELGKYGVTGTAVRAAESRMSARTTVMCLLCQTAQSGDAVSLFTARRAGAAGRNGNTVGTYMCADLGCAERVRTEIPPWLQDRNPAEVVAERAAELRERVQGLVDAVRR